MQRETNISKKSFKFWHIMPRSTAKIFIITKEHKLSQSKFLLQKMLMPKAHFFLWLCDFQRDFDLLLSFVLCSLTKDNKPTQAAPGWCLLSSLRAILADSMWSVSHHPARILVAIPQWQAVLKLCQYHFIIP